LCGQSLIYPISVNYRPDWGTWEALREGIYQEFLDNFPQGFTLKKTGKKSSGHSSGRHLLVEGRGKVFALKDLILGVTDKRQDPSKRGEHGEGTKIAWLVLTRLGIRFRFYSGDRVYTTRLCQLHGEECLEVTWEEAPFFDGARYILDYDGPLYEERVLQPDDPRILWHDGKGRRILEQGEDPDLFVKGLWVQKGRLYAPLRFGYDLQDPKLDLSRNMVSPWQAETEIGRMWGQVTDPKLLHTFYTAAILDHGKWGEAQISLTLQENSSSAQAHRQVLQELLGAQAVIRTSKEASREAEWRGAEPIEVPYSLKEGLQKIMDTDQKFLEKRSSDSEVLVPIAHLSAQERKLLAWLRGRVQARWPKLQILVCLMEQDNGKARENLILLHPRVLQHPLQALAITAHEVSHIVDGVEDLTSAQIDSVARVASYLYSTYPHLDQEAWAREWR